MLTFDRVQVLSQTVPVVAGRISKKGGKKRSIKHIKEHSKKLAEQGPKCACSAN